MNNSTQTAQTTNTSDNSEITEDKLAEIVAAKDAAMNPEQRAALEAKAIAWGASPVEEVTNKVNAELSQAGIGRVDSDKVDAITVMNRDAGKNNAEEIANQVVASEAAYEMMSNPSQPVADSLYDKYGNAAVDAKNVIRDGSGLDNLALAGKMISEAEPPGQTADEARAELTVKSQDGQLSGQEQATADFLGVDTEQEAQSDESIEGVKEQITELNQKIASEGGQVVQFEDFSKMIKLKDQLVELETKNLAKTNPNQSLVAAQSTETKSENIAALRAQIDKLHEAAELATKQAEQEALPKAA
ncbi:hypothetical protein FWF93_03375 [Candidatus Saccharibacteria bacterium]|nr:hypothetical protein [Candidatus Saccharibacteria bacterium]